MTSSQPLSFDLPDGTQVRVEPRRVFNAGYAGRNQAEVQAHIDELADLGVPAPETTPTLYPVAPYLAQQTDVVAVQHGRTSGEAEWAIVVAGPGEDDVLLTCACDHTDRSLEVHGVAWSKNASPDVLGRAAWRLTEVADRLDAMRITARVGQAGTVIQDTTLGALLPPKYWLDVLRENGWFEEGTVLISGTVPMVEGVDQFADRWEVTLTDVDSGREATCGYRVEVLPEPIG
jgi:hypothetical protein